jgi:ion channel
MAQAAAPAGPGSRPPHQDRFGALLLVLVVSYLLSAFVSAAWVSAIQIILFVTVAGLAVRSAQIRRRAVRQLAALTAAGSVVAILLALTHSADAGAGAASLWAALILLFAVAAIVRRVLTHPAVTLQSILGAVSAYMIIGLMFAALYGAMNRFGGGGFFAHGSAANIKTFQYFSFTTLTTLGYGDFTAAGSGGRAVAVLEALIGQVFLATLVARLVAAFRGPREERAAGGSAGAAPAMGGKRRPGRPAGHAPPVWARRAARQGGPDAAAARPTWPAPRARGRPARRSPRRPGR